MTMPWAPRLDQRRTEDFVTELLDRAHAWIPSWSVGDDEPDFGRTLIEIAARFSSEVAERLDGVGDKMRAGFLDWLAITGEAARPARMPVVFKLADNAPAPILAPSPIRMQADAGERPVIFETEIGVQLVPGTLDIVVGVDADQDAYYLPFPGINDLNPLEPLPTQWHLKSFAAAGSNKLQLDPDAGLVVGMLIELAGSQYKVTQVEGDIVTIDPPVSQSVETEVINKVGSFAPFDGAAHNWQEHALYLGDLDLLNIEAAASVEVAQAKNLVTGFRWEYWGKVDRGDQADWQELTVASDEEQKKVSGLLLKKNKGSIEPLVIDGKNSRWIRAYLTHVDDQSKLATPEPLTLAVNCMTLPKCPTADAIESPPSEAMANTTPLVLSRPFYPLGRTPRQFDAFYLGNKEAFSKKNANVSVCFNMSDATCLAYAAVRSGTFAYQILAGVGKDRALHLFKIDPATGSITSFRGPLQPPRPAEPNAPVDNSAAPISLNPSCIPVIWNGDTAPNDFYVAVGADGDIWIWHENATDAKQSGWQKQHSSIPKLPNLDPYVDAIVVLKSAPRAPGAALSHGRFWVYNDPEWIQPSTGVPLRDYASLTPIYDANGGLTNSMVAISTASKLYRLETDGTETAIASTVDPFSGDPNAISPKRSLPFTPAAYEDAAKKTYIVALGKDQTQLFAVQQGSAPQIVALSANAEVLGSQINATKVGGQWQFSVAERTDAGEFVVASWTPTFVSTDPTILFEYPIPGSIAGTPLPVGNFVAVPGARGDAYVSRLDTATRLSFKKPVLDGVVVASPPEFSIGDRISVLPLTAGNSRMEWQISKLPSIRGNDVIYVVDPAVGDRVADDPQLMKYSNVATGTGTVGGTKSFTVAPADPHILAGAILRIEGPAAINFCEVEAADPGTGVITTKTALPATSGQQVSYWLPTPAIARVVPAIEFVPAGDGNWDASILDYANIYFLTLPPPQPSPQRAIAYGITGGHPTIVALNRRWSASPPPLNANTAFIIDAAIGSWSHELGATASNPDLSWEYWNGTAWWSLPITYDGTDRLASSGAVTFAVPNDMAESDWAGKSNFWIRARLVGGDYGQEEVKVVIDAPNSAGQTLQTVERSSDKIRAPLVIDLSVAYTICKPVLPRYVLTQDSGSMRDQSDANQTGGAIVEAFVPIGVTLGRLSGALPASTATPDCSSACDCSPTSSSTALVANTSSSAIANVSPAAAGRAVLLGLTKPPSGAPVNILLVVDQERKHDAFAPMKIEALVGDRFIPIVTKDATRALGETGVLSLAFALEPTTRELFGNDRCWIRLTPGVSAVGEWKPALRGTYLNGVWASATETLTRELVGSSEGAPNLTLYLARPPLLRNTLELRVKEPLSDEERDALLNQDKNLVNSVVQDLPGDWVLWKQVIDPADESPAARVYALDESLGEIRFGDGQHGMIPPIGTDSIVAFKYQRTEANPDNNDLVPGNAIASRTQLNLISPVPTVESVLSADQAAGGAPPESVNRVVRFGSARLRHRERVISAQDLEEIALESSPKIVQAHCQARASGVRLIVVMQGDNPAPSAADTRELTRFLLAAAPLPLAGADVLRIEPPKVRRLRLALQLRIDDLDNAGEIANLAADKLKALFDTSTGAVTKDGWPLGLNPTETDIAVALIDTPHLQSIEKVQLIESLDEHTEGPWPTSLLPNELVMLAKDPVRIEFAVPEVVA